MKRLAAIWLRCLGCWLCCLGCALAGGGTTLDPGYFRLPYQTLRCQSGQVLQYVPTNTQSLIIRRYRGRSYALSFMLGTRDGYSGGGLILEIQRDGAFAIQLGRLRDLCPHPNAGH